jgi:hypothetical protein
VDLRPSTFRHDAGRDICINGNSRSTGIRTHAHMKVAWLVATQLKGQQVRSAGFGLRAPVPGP